MTTTLPTTLPTTVAGGGGAITLRETLADVLTRFTIGNDGVFQVGQVTPGGRIFVSIPDFRGDTGGLLPGFSSNVILRGPCVTIVAAVPHLGACKSGGQLRTDGTTGVFQEISVAEWNDPKGPFFDATAANWIEGVGLTCDNPLALGYRAAGYSVSWVASRIPHIRRTASGAPASTTSTRTTRSRSGKSHVGAAATMRPSPAHRATGYELLARAAGQ